MNFLFCIHVAEQYLNMTLEMTCGTIDVREGLELKVYLHILL